MPPRMFTPTLESSLAGNLMAEAPVKVRNFTTKQRIFMREKSWEKSICLFPSRTSFFLSFKVVVWLLSWEKSIRLYPFRVSFFFLLKSLFGC